MLVPITLVIFSILSFQSASWAQTCAVSGWFAGQNLAIGDISGSTPTQYPDSAPKPRPSTAAAWACIRRSQYRQLLQAGTYPNNVDVKRNVIDVAVPTATPEPRPQDLRRVIDDRGKAVACKPNTLVFARGTIPDVGAAGLGTVGAALSKALQARPGQADNWLVQAVNYTNDGSGFSCYGLPGGLVALNQLNTLGASCNTTKFIVGGFSQGAMVAHIAVANAEANVKNRIARVLTFGDPFNGSQIRGYHGDNVKVSCADGDNICNACFNGKPGNHNGYTASQWIDPAVDFILQKISS